MFYSVTERSQSPERLDESSSLSLLADEQKLTFSHYVDIDAGHLDRGVPAHVHLLAPKAEGDLLAKTVAMTILIPEGALRAFWHRRLDMYAQKVRTLRGMVRHTIVRPPRSHAGMLAALGVTALPQDRDGAVAALVKSQYLATPLSTAAALVSHHPNLANIQPSTSAIILNDHILPDPDIDPTQYNAMMLLAGAIKKDGSDWSPVIPSTDQNGKQLEAQYSVNGIAQGQTLQTYGLSDGVSATLAAPVTGANRSASNDPALANKTWAPNSGTASRTEASGAPTGRSPATDGVGAERTSPARPGDTLTAPDFIWTVDEQTDHHGVSVKGGSITIDVNRFSIDVGNSYLRTLYAGYQLLDEAGQPIGSKSLLSSISATNTLLGIPMPTDPTQLSFDLQTASSVQLLFGSLGTADWDADVSWRGALLTGLWQYGIPIVFLIAGKAITSTSLFNKIVNDKDLTAAALAVALPIVGGGVATAAALTNTKQVLISFGDAVLSIIVQKGLEKLGEWIAEQVAEGELSAAFGPVGWVFRAAAAVMDFEEMAVTTGEVLSSPATVRATVSRAMNVTLALRPDPRHGEVGKPDTAVWPALADNYSVLLQYQRGTNRRLTGPMPATTSDTPLSLTFSGIPAGGQFRIVAGVYSKSGWLTGSWQSDWTAAVPPQGSSTLDLGSQTITENLVPLAPNTQYVFKERIAVAGGTYGWQAGDPPTATSASLDCQSSASLCELVDISMNNSAFQVGYAWRASGQNLPPDVLTAPPSQAQLYVAQNLSVLARPGSALKTSDVGLSNRPAIAYAPSINQVGQIDQTNFILDPRGSEMNLRQVTLDDTVGSFGLGAAGLQSWGRFPLASVDALAIHPSGLALACSFKDSKLMILPLPAAPTADADAPEALLVSGEGIRQGLLRGPKAMAVTPDGRILVLESENARVQAFDTKGNPVQGFTPRPMLFSLSTAAIAASLDARNVPDALADALVAATVGLICTLSKDDTAAFVTKLDGGLFSPTGDPLIAALADRGVILSYDPAHMGDATVSPTIATVTAGQSWTVRDPRGFVYQIVLAQGALQVSHRLASADVQVVKAGADWLVVDDQTLNAVRIVPSTADAATSLVFPSLSYFPLKPSFAALTYLDMAVEAEGYVYVLYYTGDGAKPADYVLDVYAPDGTFCFRTPDPNVTRTPQNVVTGRITVDIWRNLYGLTFETLKSPWNTPQPGIGHWMPTPPLFTLPLSAQPEFNQLNIGAISQDFAQNGITLTKDAFIVVSNPNGAWQVKNDTTIYDVYRSGDGLQVYAIPA